MFRRIALLPLAGSALALSAPVREGKAACENKVNVQIFFEPGCKYCRQYLAGPVEKAIAHETTKGCMNIDFNPLGNAFYPIPECKNAATGNQSVPSCGGSAGYDAGMRQCYNAKCGPGVAAADRADDCYRGRLVFQHGFKEAWFTRYFACAKHAASTKKWENYGQFVLCMERNYTQTDWGDMGLALVQTSTEEGAMFNDIAQTCAEASDINFDEIEKCYKSSGADDAFELEARNIPEHTGVPWVIVDGVVQPEAYDDNALLRAVKGALENRSKPSDAPRLAAIQYSSGLLGGRRGGRQRQITC